MTKYIIVDIDGTICDSSHREWHEYDKVKDDKPIEAMQEALYVLNAFYNIVYVTGRKKDSHEKTVNWLQKNIAIFEADLYMRQDNDTRPDAEVKRDIYNQHLKDLDILCVFENDIQCIKMYRELGLQCLMVC